MMLEEQALEYYFAGKEEHQPARYCPDADTLYMNKYGAQPYDSYEDQKHVNYKVLCRKVQKLCDGAISKKKAGIKASSREELNDLFDAK